MVTYRGWLVALGIGMGLLWIVGLSAAYSSPTVTWLDFAVAVLSFIGAAAITGRTRRQAVTTWAVALAVGIFAIWIGCLVRATTAWQTWWNFVFAFAYLLLGVAASTGKPRSVLASEDRLPPRKAA